MDMNFLPKDLMYNYSDLDESIKKMQKKDNELKNVI